MVVRNSINNCGFFPNQFPAPVGCDSTILDTDSYFATLFTKIPFAGAAPITLHDQVIAITGTPVVIDVLFNDLVGDSAIDPATVQLLVPATLGTTSINPATGEVTYTATASTGAEVLYYRVSDANGNLSTFSTVSVNVSQGGPVVVDDTETIGEDITLVSSVSVLANDTDPDLDFLTVVAGTYATVQAGSISLDSVGNYSYTPAAGFSGTDSFDYTVTDGTYTDIGRLVITVTSVNDLPVANIDSGLIAEDTQLLISILGNDSDIDGTLDPASIITSNGPFFGTLSVDGSSGDVTYTPNADYNGADSFDYTVNDDVGGASNLTAVNITVTPVNDAPTLVDDLGTVAEDDTFGVLITVLVNDTDVDGTIDPASLAIVSPASNGSLTVDPSFGDVTYIPDPDYFGPDTFTYTVQDDLGLVGSAATVTITVTPVNDAPIAITSAFVTADPGQMEPVAFGQQVTLDGTTSADVDGSIVSYLWTQVSGSAVVLSNAAVAQPTFNAPASRLVSGSLFVGETLEFELQVTDNDALTSPTGTMGSTVLVTVAPAFKQQFHAVEESIIPFKAGVDVGRTFYFDFSGGPFAGLVTNDRVGSAPFTWVEDPVNGILNIDFTGIPVDNGRVFETELLYKDVSFDLGGGSFVEGNDGVAEALHVQERIDFLDITLTTDGLNVDQVSIVETGEVFVDDITNGATLTPSLFTARPSELNFYVTDTATSLIPFAINALDVLSLPLTGFTTSISFPKPTIDVLTFNETGTVGTGNALIYADTFTWGVAAFDGRLQVVMDAVPDTSDYLKLANKASGDLVLADYFVDGELSPLVMSTLSWQGQVLVWDASDLVANIAGDYNSEGRARLDDGTVIPVTSVYRLHPDGTGLVQTPFYDLATGLLAGYDTYGICVSLNGDSLGISRIQADGIETPDPDNIQPSVNDCVERVDPRTGTYTSYGLVDIVAGSTYRMVAFNDTHECGQEPFLFPQPSDCTISNPLVPDDIYPAIFTKVPFLSPVTSLPPIIAVDDLATVFGSTLVIDLLANDIVDAASVAAMMGGFVGANTTPGTPNSPVILVEVLINGVWQTTGTFATGFGAATVTLSPDGVVTYTSEVMPSGDADVIYYRLTDTNGNTSVAAMVMQYVMIM
jgi:VCBS repeat-containing protein